jgi:hypothetical protein
MLSSADATGIGVNKRDHTISYFIVSRQRAYTLAACLPRATSQLMTWGQSSD